MDCPADFQIRIVPQSDRLAALWLLFAGEPVSLRARRIVSVLDAATKSEVDLNYLYEAYAGDQRIAVICGQPAAGRSGQIWPPRVATGASWEVADSLLIVLDSAFRAAGMAMSQALLPAEEKDQAGCLARQGYACVAQLLYLWSQVESFPSESPASVFSFEPFRDSEAARLCSVIEQTYVGSHDAPSLDGWRSPQDVLAGYRATGEFSADRWMFVRHADQDVGCLLLTDHPAARHWELIYMGLVPAVRGRGWSQEVVRFAQWKTREAGRDVLILSVDSANSPAISVYSRCGFTVLERRDVWVKKFHN